MSHVNVLERQTGRKEIGRINHSEKLTSSARQSAEIQWEAENQRDGAYLPPERTDRIQSRVLVFAEWGLCPQKRLLLTTTVSTMHMTGERSTQRNKGEADSDTHCRELKKMLTCSLHTLILKNWREAPHRRLHFRYLWVHTPQRREVREMDLNVLRRRGHSRWGDVIIGLQNQFVPTLFNLKAHLLQ